MFDGLSPEVAALLEAAKSDLPAAHADAHLLSAMATAVSADGLVPSPSRRSRKLLGKVLTAKAAALAGVLVLSGGVASAATGSLPGPAQNAASTAAAHVGLHIPKSDDSNKSGDDSNDGGNDATSTTVAHPDNHGNDVSTVAHDDSTTGADHGAAVCAVASDNKCQPDASGEGKSADHRQDGDHATTTTTVTGDTTTTHPSGDNHPNGDSNPGTSHHGSGGSDGSDGSGD